MLYIFVLIRYVLYATVSSLFSGKAEGAEKLLPQIKDEVYETSVTGK